MHFYASVGFYCAYVLSAICLLTVRMCKGTHHMDSQRYNIQVSSWKPLYRKRIRSGSIPFCVCLYGNLSESRYSGSEVINASLDLFLMQKGKCRKCVERGRRGATLFTSRWGFPLYQRYYFRYAVRCYAGVLSNVGGWWWVFWCTDCAVSLSRS